MYGKQNIKFYYVIIPCVQVSKISMIGDTCCKGRINVCVCVGFVMCGCFGNIYTLL